MAIARRNLLVTLEVTSKDRSYPWVLQWLSAQGKRTQHLSVETSLRPLQGQMATTFGFVPGPGQHFIRHQGRFMMVQRIREQQMVDLNTGKPWEKVQFIGFGQDTTQFEGILQEAFEMAKQQEEGKTIVYSNWGTEWRPFGAPRTRRPLDSVILDSGVSEGLLADLQEWRRSKEWYLSRGIPYRRGYLLHGPPGSGKSSFIMALAGFLEYNVCVLNLAERGLTDERLGLALANVPAQSLVLLEDIDAAFPSRAPPAPSASLGGGGQGAGLLESLTSRLGRRPGDGGHSSSDVTFSGLLNVLDGVASSEERLVFMTTNHVERLDPALVRPGRVDVTQLIDNANAAQAAALLRRFFPDAKESDQDAFVATLGLRDPGSPAQASMATLQGHLLKHKHNLQSALAPDSLEELTTPLHSPQYFDPAAHCGENMPISTADQKTDIPSEDQAGSSSSSSGVGVGTVLARGVGAGEKTATFSGLPEGLEQEGSPQSLQEAELQLEVLADALEQAEKDRARFSAARRAPLSASDVDRMVFNPQEGWDEDIKQSK
jgi:chaperone BCS1